MGERFLIDTNVVIYTLEGSLPFAQKPIIASIIDDELNISIITKIELLSRQLNEKDEKIIREFIDRANIYPLENKIAETASRIRKSYNLKIPDAVISATALENDFVLVTRNAKDFSRVKELKIYNPFETKNRSILF